MGAKKILLVLAHPDDESFIMGGTAAKLVHNGDEVYLYCATRGEAGKCGTPPICTQAELGQVREQEVRHAAKILGIKGVDFMDYIDAKTPEVDAAEAVAKLVGYMEQLQPEVVITFGPDGMSGHKDHITVGRWATEAAKQVRAKGLLFKLYYFTMKNPWPGSFKRTPPAPYSPVTHAIDVRGFMQTKLEAIKAHRTQNHSYEKHFCHGLDFLEKHFGHEYFSQVWPEFEAEQEATAL